MKTEFTPDYAAMLYDRAERLHALIDGLASSPLAFPSDLDAAMNLARSIRAALVEVEQGLVEWKQRMGRQEEVRGE